MSANTLPFNEGATGLRLYHSPKGLFPFQAEDVAVAYLRPTNYVTWDTGTGKTHFAMALGALLFEDDLIDLMIVIAERGKLDRTEWPNDFATYTNLDVALYHGPKRAKLRENPPQVMLSTYETFREDLVRKETTTTAKGRTTTSLVDGPLMSLLRSKRVAIVYDEGGFKFKKRSSALYKAHEYMLKELRKLDLNLRVINMTATPVDKNPEDAFNALRLIAPRLAPTVADFKTNYIATYDLYDNPVKFKNLTAADRISPDVTPFADIFGKVMLRRRKTDPELIGYFPKRVEEYTHVAQPDLFADFYETVTEAFEDSPALYVALRQIAGDPRSMLVSNSKVAKEITNQVGAQGLHLLGNPKRDALLDRLNVIVKGQGAQVVIFSFFTSVLQYLVADLRDSKYTVSYHHGGQSATEQAKAKEDFRSGKTQLFVTSDAGARGLNLQCALYVEQFELPLTHALYVQRMDRNHRIDSTFASVTNNSYVLLDSIEAGIESLGHRRNVWSDKVLGDEDAGENFITAEQRRILTRISKARAEQAA